MTDRALLGADTGPNRGFGRGPSRRAVLRGVGVAAATAVQMPFVRPTRAATRSLKVSTFGGYFERMFAQHVYPAFTKNTGIEVQSVEQPEGAQFLFQLAEANKAGMPPMDVCCMAGIDVLRGRAQGMWRGFDHGLGAILNVKLPAQLRRDDNLALGGKPDGIGFECFSHGVQSDMFNKVRQQKKVGISIKLQHNPLKPA